MVEQHTPTAAWSGECLTSSMRIWIPGDLQFQEAFPGFCIEETESAAFAAGMSSTLANEEETSWKGNPPTTGQENWTSRPE
ncbi:hypothetical protein LSTR_LSTR001056 [Laodelphax striatellus]|uniref:Uncharacterized protein n=1 Tax=Laodelphax striatellus TaxID=195883 RepID=A0A482X109_LAOST|nr:hypothetical protein LSTR_LSTR001056 [Laodelphax striatellus]